MLLTKTQNLSIEKRGDILVQKWLNQNLTIEDFQSELYHFLNYYLKMKPKSVLWLHEDFNFEVPESLFNWINNEILSHQYANGIENIAFTVSRDKLAQLSVAKSLPVDENQQNTHRFFMNEKEAFFALTQKKYDENENDIYCELTPKNDRVRFNLEVSYRNLSKTVNSINSLKKQCDFINLNQKRFNQLTKKEVEILALLCKGFSSKEIASLLFIEDSTVYTHRKHINRKLEIKSMVDLYRYGLSFNLIDF